MVLPLILESKWTYYYAQTGSIRTENYYEGNQLLKNRNWKETGEEDISDVFPFADTIPEYPGGVAGLLRFLRSELRYPNDAHNQGIEGKVVVQFIVMEDGKVDGIKILKGKSPSLDEESIRVVRLMSGKWKPGILNGKKVRVYFTLPVIFQL